MGKSDFGLLTANIKKIVKNRHLTYRQLADKIGISESGLKKILNGQDASFGRLIDICRALAVPLSELLTMEKEWQPHSITFTEKQQELLLDDELALKVFFLAGYDDLCVEGIERYLNLTRTTLYSVLRKLDEVGLVQWLPDDEIKFPRDGIVLWVEQGELVRQIKRNWGEELLNDGIEAEPEDRESQMLMKYLKLTDSSHEDLQQALGEVLEEFQRRSRREINLHGMDKLRGTRMISVLCRGSFVKPVAESGE
ncbi:MAG: helix-turn-helix transcriptional regulator [Pseudobacteriovorax sp.]|nr:helix-turn-helix transcriptional regulator [Pseudobacteriovorax sp.]